MINQMIFKQADNASNGREPGVFFQYGWAPGDRNNVSQYSAAGFTCMGVLSGRKKDILAAGIGNERLNGPGPGRINAGMTNIEIFYIAQVASLLALQPDIQYFSNIGFPPNGSGLAVGLRTILKF